MKASARFSPSSLRRRAATSSGFTLPELMIAITLFLLLLGGVLVAHLFGFRMSRLTESRLETNRTARKVLGQFSDDIRGCTKFWVGSISNGVFVENLDGPPQTGSALLVQPTTNASKYIVYFMNPSDQSFRRTTSEPESTSIIAQSVTNELVFSARDFEGNVVTNNQLNHVVHLKLEFFQPQTYLPAPDHFNLETSATRRTRDSE